MTNTKDGRRAAKESKYPRIEDVEKPVPGRRYDVPCVRVLAGSGWYEGQVVAVLGDEHEDKEIIGFPHPHFHPDHRFSTNRTMRRKLDGFKSMRRRTASQAVFAAVITLFEPGVFRAIKRCRRPHATFPQARWTKALEAKYAGTNAKCGVCPHRGMPLAGAPVRNGARICPGHGLGFDVLTGKLQPRGRR